MSTFAACSCSSDAVNINIRTSNKAIPLNYVLLNLMFISCCDGFFFFFCDDIFSHNQCNVYQALDANDVSSTSLIQIYIALMTIIPLIS